MFLVSGDLVHCQLVIDKSYLYNVSKIILDFEMSALSVYKGVCERGSCVVGICGRADFVCKAVFEW